MKRIIGVAAIVLLIAGAVHLFENYQNAEHLSAIQNGEPREHRDAPKTTRTEVLKDTASVGYGSTVAPRIIAAPVATTELYRAASADALLSYAARLPADSLDVRHQLTLLSQYCGYVKRDEVPQQIPRVPEAPRAHRSDAAHRDSEQFMAMLERFCGAVDAGQLASVAEHAARMADRDANGEVTQFLSSLAEADIAELASEENQRVLMEVAAKTESPEIFRRALDLAAIGGTAHAFVEFDRSLPAGVSGDRRIELRRLAAQVAFCDWTGGCGPGTLQAISSCTYFGRCSPGYSWVDTLGGMYTPREVESVRNLGRVLLQGAKG